MARACHGSLLDLHPLSHEARWQSAQVLLHISFFPTFLVPATAVYCKVSSLFQASGPRPAILDLKSEFSFFTELAIAYTWNSCCRRLIYVRAFGPLTVTVLSIAILNIFKIYRPPASIKTVGTIPKVINMRGLTCLSIWCQEVISQ